MQTLKTILMLAGAFVATSPAWAADVPYPAGYRDWHHVKSMLINQGHPLYDAFGGIHHIYANAKAMKGYRTGKFENGSVIVFDLLEAKPGDNAVQEGNRKVTGVMHRDTGHFAATGGWGFEGFKGDSKSERAVGANATSACFECHAPQKGSSYVFSKLRP
jgi:hypothetical protein